MTALTARSCKAGSENANFAMNIATVKPMPAVLPTATSAAVLAPSGSWATFALEAPFDAMRMPSGLPNAKPQMMPQAIGDVKISASVGTDSETPELAKAKIGITTKAEKP